MTHMPLGNVVNLVTNAIKYSGEEKWVRLRLMHQDELPWSSLFPIRE